MFFLRRNQQQKKILYRRVKQKKRSKTHGLFTTDIPCGIGRKIPEHVSCIRWLACIFQMKTKSFNPLLDCCCCWWWWRCCCCCFFWLSWTLSFNSKDRLNLKILKKFCVRIFWCSCCAKCHNWTEIKTMNEFGFERIVQHFVFYFTFTNRLCQWENDQQNKNWDDFFTYQVYNTILGPAFKNIYEICSLIWRRDTYAEWKEEKWKIK